MRLYISKEQLDSMRFERCLACGKIRSMAFWQPQPQYPVVIYASKNEQKAEIKIQDICTCDDSQSKE